MEREIAGAVVHEYRLALEAGSFLRVRIEPKGAGVKVRLLGTGGEEMAALQQTGGRARPGALSLVTPAAADDRLIVAARDPQAPAGTYRIEVEALRPAAAGDAERVAADRSFAAAQLALAEETAAAKTAARHSFEEALAAWKAAADAIGQVDALLALAEIDSDEAQDGSALARCREALALAEASGYRAGSATALREQGDIFLHQSDLDRALASYREALALWQALGSPAGEAATRNGMGLTYGRMGMKDKALAAYEDALSLRRRAGDLGGEVLTLTAIAGIRLAGGEIGEAGGELERALFLSQFSGRSRDKASVLYNLGIAQRYRSELEASLASFEEALSINRRLGDRDYEPDILHAVGSLYVDLGDRDKALARYEEALRLCPRERSALCEARELSSIGWAQYLAGNDAGALDSAGRALARSREARDEQREASSFYTMGVALTALGRTREALSPLAEALRLRRAGGSILEQAFALLAFANARRELGEAAAAEGGYKEALDLMRPVGLTAVEAYCLFNWALLDRSAGRLQEALTKITAAVAKVESVRSRVTTQSLRTSFFASKRQYYELWVDLLMSLEQRSPGEGYAAAALEASERARARALLDLLAEARIDVEEGADPALKRRQTDLEARLSWLQERLFKAAPADRTPYQEEVGRIEEDLDRLDAEVRRSDPRSARVRHPMPLGLTGIRSILDDDTAFLEYFVGREGSFLFVATRSGLAVYRLPGLAVLAEEVRKVREAMQGGSRRLGDFVEQASRLYATLLGPAADALAGKSRFLISPDGPLHLLPFEALLTGEPRGNVSFSDLPYLLHRVAVAYVPSASVLAGLRETRASLPGAAAPKELVAFADPLVEAGATRLARSEGEVRAIAALYPPDAVRIYLREEASEDRVKHDPVLETARRIHFATHGFVTEPPLSLSGLVLTRVPGSPEDGVLQVREIFNLHLNADLVTLSACETGLGKEVSGEGVVGMTRAFFYAGARSLLVSFWKVSDASTPHLMQAFYSHLGEPGGKAEALRRAKEELITGKTYAQPYYWAPFLLSGDLQ